MPYPLRQIQDPTERADSPEPRPGDFWFAPWLRESGELSPHYDGSRGPIVIVCPGGAQWVVDFASYAAGERVGDGWRVTGTPPYLTATPSIVVAGYHGWLRDGALSDDLEGRKYA